MKVKCSGASIDVWVGGTVPFSTVSDSDIPWGYVALAGWQAKFQNLKAGYDTNADSDIDDAGDNVVIDEAFSGTSVSPTYDNNGNLTKDADYAYVYDAWNNLVKVMAQNDSDVTIATYAFYGDDRMSKKTVTNRGLLDGTTYYYYDEDEVIEERNGSEQVTQQYVYPGRAM